MKTKRRGDPIAPKCLIRAIARLLSDDYHNHQLCSMRAKIDGQWRTLPIVDWKETDDGTVFETATISEKGRFEVLQFVDDENRLISQSTGPIEFDTVHFTYRISFPEELTCDFEHSR